MVGLGQFGRAFTKLFAAHPLVDKLALCDCEADRIKEQLDDPAIAIKSSAQDCYTSLDDICKADLDAIVVITQPWLHAPQCLQVMESGKYVYSAVPVICLPDFDECMDWCGKICETVKRTGMQYMLGETTIYRPQTMFCRRMADAGRFGKFVYAEGEYVHDVDARCNLREVNKNRFTGKVGSQAAALFKSYLDRGILESSMAYPTHSISGPIYAMRTHAVKVNAYGVPNVNGDEFFKGFCFPDVAALYQLENGASLRICEFREIGASAIDREESEIFRIFGQNGSFARNIWQENFRIRPELVKPLESTKLTDIEMRDPLPEEVKNAFMTALMPNAKPGEDFNPTGHGGSHPYLVHEFVSSVAERRESAIPAREACHWMAMAAAAHRSALHDGETVRVAKFD